MTMAGIERRLRVRPERASVGRGEASGAVVRGGTSYRAPGNRVDMGRDLETFNCTLTYSLGGRQRTVNPKLPLQAPRSLLRRKFMSKKAYAIAVAILLGATPVAFAAQTANHQPARQSKEAIQADPMSASQIIGSRVYDVRNRNIAKAQDLIVNAQGSIAAMV